MRIIKRIGLGLLILIVGLIVFLAGSIFVDGFFGQGRVDALTNTRITAPDGAEILAYLAKPDSPGPFPAVIMIHEFYGLRPDIVEKADALAQEGYMVIAPNVFRSGTTNWIPRAIYNVMTADTSQIDGDVEAVYQWLISQPEVKSDRVGIMGFCFGGGTSLRYSLTNNKLAATVVFYGQPITDPTQLRALSGAVLGIFGGADMTIPLAEVEAMRQGLDQANVPNEITIYEGQPHAFVGSMEEIVQGGAPQEAWQQLLSFLADTLQSGKGATAVQSLSYADATASESLWRYVLRLAWSHLGHA
ncbi:MAG: dienelactone hydrolase family protein [Caldilineaceae bacterium]